MQGMLKKSLFVSLVVVAAATSYLMMGMGLGSRSEYVQENDEQQMLDTVPLPPSEYGIPMSGFVLEQGKLRSGATFGQLLASHGVPPTVIHELVELAKPHFDVRRMRSGHPFAFIFADDSSRDAAYFVYEADALKYVVFGLGDSLSVRTGKRPVQTISRSIAVDVTGALYNDFERAGADPMLAIALSEVFAWTVDFQRIQKQDRFTVVYSEQIVDGKRYGRPQITAARYSSGGRVQQAFRFEQKHGTQYFDDEGNSLRKAFLQAPLQFSRISSGFSGRRLHPVQKVMKAHLGTDYAAPYGTPILAVGDGVVEKTGQTSGNGKYVKIKHNGTYSTQYLHMRKIIARQGARVKQGDVIGEVGSTGLATGPHVCFRFWKNGVQVDHRREVFPSAEPVLAERRKQFDQLRDRLVLRLDETELALLDSRMVSF